MIGQVQATVGVPVTFTGYAGDFDRAIAAVQFSLDGGTSWTTYETPATTAERNLCWILAYTPPREGRYQLLIRAVNEDGTASPTPARVEFVAQAAPGEPPVIRAVRASRAMCQSV